MPKYTIGVSAILLGALATDGGPGLTLAALGYTNQDSCKLAQDDPEQTQFFAEELEDAVYTKTKKGATTLNFQIMNPAVDTLVALFGGTATASGSGANAIKTWNSPATTPTIEQTVKVIPQDGLTFIIPRGAVTAKLNGEFSRKNLLVIEVKITALTPTKAGVGAVQFVELTPA